MVRITPKSVMAGSPRASVGAGAGKLVKCCCRFPWITPTRRVHATHRHWFIAAVFGAMLPGSALAEPLDPAYINGPLDFTVVDVAQIPPFGEQIINPPYGVFPSDLFVLSQITGLGTPAVSDLFVSGVQGSNVDFAGPGAVQYRLRAGPTLGLVPGDHIAAVSYGFDGTGPFGTEIIFSVDPDASGAPNTDVHAQADANQAAGGLYVTGTFGPFGKYEGTPFVPPLQNIGNNEQILAPEDIGLTTGKTGLPKQSRAGLFEDDLADVELQPRLSNGNVYFALDEFSPTVVDFLNGPVSSADILVSAGNNQFNIFRDHVTLGLTAEDMVDALALSLTGNEALFSLAPDSLTLMLDKRLSPADIFITDFDGSFRPFANHTQLGLDFKDNLNALEALCRCFR